MILPDTSVWIDHIHHADLRLAELLRRGLVLIHPFVIGEIALGSTRNYDAILESLQKLPAAPMASDAEVRFMIKQHKMMSSGIGYVDAHLLASALLTDDAEVWTRDKRLKTIAKQMQIATELD